ncbi:Cyanovirin-N [Hypoxylon cercidicola]|nr:Cyanovirin-N [Hypoxylon cercidicola]
MAFSLTAKHLELRGSWLVAVVQKADGSWNFAKLNLNDHIGNNNSDFDVTMDRFYNSTADWSCHLRGPLLCAQMGTITGSYAPERCINLDLFVKNHDGSLEFQDLTDSLLLYAGCLSLKDAHLRGLVVGRDGKFVPSEIDLDQHYGNINGKFEAGERHYSRSGRNFRLEQDSNTVKLFGELMDCEGAWHDAEIDLSDCIVNEKGKLAFLKHDEEFVREDWVPTIAEQMPVLGEAVAGLHLGEDKEDHFYYEIASNTNSTDATVGIAIGTFIGRAIRSPAIGMVIGARLATSSDAFVDDKIANTSEDPEVRSQIQEAALGRHVFETLRDMLADDTAAAAAELLGTSLNPEIDSWTTGLIAWFEKQELKATVLTDLSLHTMLNKVIRQLQGETVSEWDTALDQLSSMKKNTQTLKLTPPPPPPPAPEPEPELEVADEVPPAEELQVPELRVPELQVEGAEAQDAPKAPDAQSQDSQAAPAAAAAAPQDQEDAKAQDAKVPAQQPQTQPAAGSSGTVSTRQSSDAGGSVSKGDKGSLRNGNGAACTKGWHSIFGITTFRRSWARSKQPKVVTTS